MDRVTPTKAVDDEHRVVFEYSAPWVWLGVGIGAAGLGLPERARAEFGNSRASFRQISHHALEAQATLVESADVAATYGLGEPAYRRRLAAEAEVALRRAGGALQSGLSPRIAWLRCLVLDGRWTEAADLIIKGMDGAIGAKTVTYDFHRLMEGATLRKCSEFGSDVIAHMD